MFVVRAIELSIYIPLLFAGYEIKERDIARKANACVWQEGPPIGGEASRLWIVVVPCQAKYTFFLTVLPSCIVL
jgi:hypothetical protein